MATFGIGVSIRHDDYLGFFSRNCEVHFGIRFTLIPFQRIAFTIRFPFAFLLFGCNEIERKIKRVEIEKLFGQLGLNLIEIIRLYPIKLHFYFILNIIDFSTSLYSINQIIF
jgi:hypothetical protein